MDSVRVIQPTFLVTPTDAKANLDRISELVRYCHKVFLQSGEAPYAPVIVACNRETHKALLINTKVFDPCIVPVSTLDATINVTIRALAAIDLRKAVMQVTNRHQYDAYFATDDLPAWYDKLDKKDKKLGLLLVFISTDDACRAGWKVHPFDDKQKVGAEALQLASPRQRDDDDSSDEEFGVPAEK